MLFQQSYEKPVEVPSVPPKKSGRMKTVQSELGLILLETAHPEELPGVMSLLDECAAWLHGRGIAQWALPQPPHEWEKMRVQIELEHVYLARLEADHSVIGTLRIEWEDAFLCPDDPAGAGYVHSLAIRNHVRGHRIGAGLLQWAEAQIAERGRRYVRLDCWKANPQLGRYYESLGFRRCQDFELGGWPGTLFEKEVATV